MFDYKDGVLCVTAAKNTKFSTKPVLVYLLMVEQRISNVCTSSVVRFPTGRYSHCNWPVEKLSPDMCPCGNAGHFEPFMSKLMQTIGIFMCF